LNNVRNNKYNGGIELTIVAGCVVQDNNKILMIQEGKDIVKEMWNFPSGRLENNEKILDAAIREVEEETGYKISLSGLLGVYNFLSVNNDHVIMFCYVGQVAGGNLKYDNNEIINVKWLSIDEIDELSDDKLRTYTLIRKIISDLKNKPILPLDIINDMI
jgi:8-oxo-dGTP diphosphatase